MVTFVLMLSNLATYGISVQGLRLRAAIKQAERGPGEKEGDGTGESAKLLNNISTSQHAD